MKCYNNYYLHATGGFLGAYNGLKNILQILCDGEIKTRNNNHNILKVSFSNFLSNDEISLCDTSMEKIINLISSFEYFVEFGPTLVLDRNIDIRIPKFTKEYEPNTTDLYDEVRHTGNISLNNLKFITFPLSIMQEKEVLYKNPYDNIVYSRNVFEELEAYDQIIKEIKNYYPNVETRDLFTGKYVDNDTTSSLLYKMKKDY